MDLSQIPAVPPPPGVTSNFVDPPTQAPITRITILVILPLMLLFVLLRLYSNLCISRKLDKSDYACLIATMFAVSYSSVILYTLTQNILGRHIWDVPVSLTTNTAIRSFSVLIIFYGPSIFFAKLSILLLYLQIFSIDRRTKVLVYIALTLNVMHALAIVIGNGILCVPLPNRSWQAAAATHNCRSVAVLLGLINGVVGFCIDLFIFCIPIPVVWGLQLSTKKKIGVSAIFATGFFACLASVLSIVYRAKLYKYGDNTWYGVFTYMLGSVEVNVSIMCSCMPCYATFFRHHIGSLRSLRSRLLSLSAKGRGSSESSGSGRKSRSSIPYPNSTAKRNQFRRIGSRRPSDMHSTLGSAEAGEHGDSRPLQDLSADGREAGGGRWEVWAG